MAWETVWSESPLVDASVEVRKGVCFDLRVTEQNLCYSEVKTLAVPIR